MKINIKSINIKSICATLFISLFLSCNNGIEELEKKNQFLSSLANLGNDFLSVFTSFGDSLGSVLGFNTKTTKSDVGKYFKNIENNLTTTKTSLEKIVSNMKDKGNPNATAAETAVNKLVKETLDKIIEGAKTASEAIGITGNDLLGNVAAQSQGGVAGTEVEKLIKGIKDIVDIVLKNDEGNAEAGDENKADDIASARGANAGDVGKLFATDTNIAANDKKAAADASKAVGAVTGADILQAIAKGASGEAAKLPNHKTVVGSLSVTSPKDAAVAGGIALRAMVKDGKFANGSSSVEESIRRAATSSVTKALDTLTTAVRKTIDEGFKIVRDAMKININDTLATSESGSSK
ncbi:variable large family protein (plasmid) [Borrelia coriaceae]|uniref:Variable large protein n=1 Tax=Borrelia coriaceae ATCC 43381 TaxID=1408429 RepID=W5SVM1_9SPIR|nr:variable large family protein [Borrelia coriaceae]AHH11254.1 Variable outer membrane protein [Borrelia coriaceae ATCC 43381]UPA17438.1 variable large family protein [Borrelia coriaceae]